MPGENRTPDKKIGEVKYAEEQAAHTTGRMPPHGPAEKEGESAKPDPDPANK
jgi:hypothetical protein